MMYEIVIIMFMPFGYQGDDAMRIKTLYGQPLVFETKEKCHEHVWKNLDILKAFAIRHFNGAPVKSISCHMRDSGI